MRALFVGVLAALALVASGCGSSSSPGTAHGATLAGDAAKLVPSNAVAFASIDSNLDSSQWQRVDSIVKTFTNGTSLLDRVNAKLQSKGLSWNADVAPAIGSEVDVAALAAKPTPELVAFVHPDNASKLSALVSKIGNGYSVQQIGGWSVVADSTSLFDAVRSAQSGQSLADSAAFQTAWSSVSGELLAQAYVSPRSSADKSAHADWIAADVRADTNALRLDAVIKPRGALPAVTGTSLLGDVPSGAALAVSFRGGPGLASKLSSLQLPARLAKMLPVKQFAPLLAGGGVVYARPNGVFPDIAVELAPKNPQAALTTAKSVLQSIGTRLGPLRLTAQLSNGKLVIADSPAAASALHGGAKLVNDAAFKDALAKAGVPAQRSFLAYADVAQLAPFVPVAVQAITGKAPDPKLAATLAHIGSAVAWAARSGGRIELHAWVETR
jgi:hypothetical protein